jgi:hypothetical protein
MQILKSWFSKHEKSIPDMSFGRYTDAYKSKDQYKMWDDAQTLFEDGEYQKAIEALIIYLKDERFENVIVTKDGDTTYLQIFQGSKKVDVEINLSSVRATAPIAYSEKYNIGLMRKLLESNYELSYSRYALNKEDIITMIFDSSALDLTPYKFYFALKELAINADKQDDLLVKEFSKLKAVQHAKVIPIDQKIQKVKYQFLKSKIDGLLTFLDETKLNLDHFQAGLGYILVDIVYRLDYLLVPHGYVMDSLEKIHNRIFTTGTNGTESKNQFAIRALKKIGGISEDMLFEELYDVIYTFGVVKPVNHDVIKTLIEGEANNLAWYQKQGRSEFVMAICGYIVGFSMFSYAPPLPVRDFFHLYYAIVENKFFNDLGYPHKFVKGKDTKPIKKAIIEAIGAIEERHKENFPKLKPEVSFLNFDDLPTFAMSFLQMVHVLDLTENEDDK